MTEVLTSAGSRWFWLSMLTVLAWAGWALLLKIVADQLPGETALLLQSLGMAPALLWLLLPGIRRDAISGAAQKWRGIVYSVLIGAVSGVGILFMLAAYRRGGNAAVVSVSTSLYPFVTCALAFIFLKEKLSARQWCGLALSFAAIVLFAL